MYQTYCSFRLCLTMKTEKPPMVLQHLQLGSPWQLDVSRVHRAWQSGESRDAQSEYLKIYLTSREVLSTM